MKIGELAKRGLCSVETIRFYEKEGLLEAPSRDVNGYRQYASSHLAQLNFIRHCRSLGMGLPEVRILRDLQTHPELACNEINQLLDSQIERVHEQIVSLRLLEQQLRSLRGSCHADTTIGNCAILRNLEQAAENEGCPCHAVQENN
jgi:Cd(II)/Pb(II)-responsive transcriptional regulator